MVISTECMDLNKFNFHGLFPVYMRLEVFFLVRHFLIMSVTIARHLL